MAVVRNDGELSFGYAVRTAQWAAVMSVSMARRAGVLSVRIAPWAIVLFVRMARRAGVMSGRRGWDMDRL